MTSNYSIFKDKGLTGLANVGNSCYINSCLQALSNCYELNLFLDSDLFKKNINSKSKEGLLLIEWNKLREMMWSENCVVAPYGFLNYMRTTAVFKQKDIFSSFAQNDVQEFLLFLLDCFHEGLKREVQMTITGNIKNEKDKLANTCFKMMRNMFKKEYSEILNLFYGISVTLIKSKNNNEILSISPEPFSLLSLSIPSNKKNIDIMNCFDYYCMEEIMEGENAWYNDETKKYEDIIKSIKFWNLPTILIIDLKRFTNSNKKLHNLISINLEEVDLSNYVVGYDKQEYIYEVFAVLNHSGSVLGGHYTAFIKNPNNNWYEYNDTNIQKINYANVITSKAYCLFLRKKNS